MRSVHDGPADNFYVVLSRGTSTSDDLDVIKDAIGTNVASGDLRMRTPSEPGYDCNEGSFSVVVYFSARDDHSKTTISYDRTVYDVMGPRVGEL